MAKRPAVVGIAPPHAMPRYQIADVVALKAMVDGNADEAQQKRFLQWLLRDVCATGTISFHPGDPMATAFKEGRRSVGVILYDLLTTPIDKLKRTANATSESASLAGRTDGRDSSE